MIYTLGKNLRWWIDIFTLATFCWSFCFVFAFRLLLTDPKSRKVIICESPLVPIVVKQTIARLLFDYFQVPSLSFVPIHLMALLTTGLTTGLVIDCGHLETTTLPVRTRRCVCMKMIIIELTFCLFRSTLHVLWFHILPLHHWQAKQ